MTENGVSYVWILAESESEEDKNDTHNKEEFIVDNQSEDNKDDNKSNDNSNNEKENNDNNNETEKECYYKNMIDNYNKIFNA